MFLKVDLVIMVGLHVEKRPVKAMMASYPKSIPDVNNNMIAVFIAVVDGPVGPIDVDKVSLAIQRHVHFAQFAFEIAVFVC